MKQLLTIIACCLGLLVSQPLLAKVVYVHNDVLGSPVMRTDANGNVISRAHYKPFGETLEAAKNDVGYTGHLNDTDLGLSYMQARYYDPVIGRFYSNDPIGFRDVHSFNRYAYANNNPYKYTDPDGKNPLIALGAIIGGIGGGVSSALNGGSWGDIASSTVSGAITGGIAGLTGGTSLLSMAAVSGVSAGVSDAMGQTISNFSSENIDTSSAESFVETGIEALGDAVSSIDTSTVAVSTVLGTVSAPVQKLTKVMGFSDKASSIVAETTGVLNSAHVDDIAKEL